MPPRPKALRADYFSIAGAPALATDAFRGWILDGETAATTANKAPKSTVTACAVAECASLDGSRTDAQRARASN